MAQPRRNDFLIPTIGVLFDSIAIEFAFLLSYWLRFNTRFLSFLPLSEDIPALDAYVYGSLVVIPLWLLLFNSRKMYAARRNVALADDFYSIVRLVTLGMLVVMSGAFFYRAFSYSRAVFGLLWVTSVGFIFIGRFLLNQTEKSLYRRGKELRNAVIIGNTETANRIFDVLHNHPLLGYRFVGYCARQPVPGNSSLAKALYLGTPEELPSRLSSERIELALIALKHEEYDQLFELVRMCEGVNVEFMVVPDILDMMAGQMRVVELEGIPFIKLKGVPMTTWGRILKRMFDFIVSLLLLVVFSPVLVIIAVFIKLDSKGPVFFKQERIGLDGKQFNILKFRSMNLGAEQLDRHAGLGIRNDSRRTRIGKVLRRTSFDELPQLFNVMSGEMSLVGPRPERTYFVEQFKSIVPKYLDRHRLKTGITGWAQVNGFRGDSSLEDRIKYDIYYIENWSLWFDIKILLKTIHAVFSKTPQHDPTPPANHLTI
ncbi:MAG: undecaprenyl-phosphate glucose phosphotransferase [Bacteroidota bacterium]|jgi:Undecaprenyl-phosphate glucose phosphotransferase